MRDFFNSLKEDFDRASMRFGETKKYEYIYILLKFFDRW
jgi:hypothetical protein